MTNYGVNELRRKYLEFFESKDHLKMNSFSLVPQNDTFRQLVAAVREIRAQSSICPSASSEFNVSKLLSEISENNVYKSDYDRLTLQLLEEQIPYEMVIKSLKEIASGHVFD